MVPPSLIARVPSPPQLREHIEEKTKSMKWITCPPSVRDEFIRWKDGFLVGEIEPQPENSDYAVAKRKKEKKNRKGLKS